MERASSSGFFSVLSAVPDVEFAILFGSSAAGAAGRDSDLDVAVDAGRPLTGSSARSRSCPFSAQIISGRVARNLDLGFPIPGFGNVEGSLHAKQRIHFCAKGLFNSQGHLGRK
jgi:hypothetical protein